MRNQPFNPAFSDHDPDGDSFIDPPAFGRFCVLGVLFAVGAVIVLSRITWVQAKLQERYQKALNTSTVEYELIPARDGRILSESSDVFATDVDQYSVQIHYRWLQNPIDKRWVQRQIRNTLSRTERQSVENVERFTTSLEAERRNMWRQIADVAGLSPAEFESRRTAIQAEVTRIADSVNRRRSETINAGPSDSSNSATMKIAAAIRDALTSTPRRQILERIVVREEESWHEIVTDVPLRVAGRIREQTHLFPGVRVIANSRRIYPLSSVAAHMVGARTPATDEELKEYEYNVTTTPWRSRTGRFGVERSYNHQLKGLPGLRKIVRSRRMEIIESTIERQPVSGRDVLLTINVDLQKHAEQLLAEALLDQPTRLLADAVHVPQRQTPQSIPTGGSIVVMDITTGRIVAAASAPTFSLSLYTGASDNEWKMANADKRHPFLSRVTQTALPPGSIMKPVTAIAAIETKAINPDAIFQCQGYLTQPDKHRCLIFRLYGRGHRDTNLPRAIAESCNVYFFTAAQRIGFSPLRQWCEKFGFGRKTGIDIPFEVAGNLPGTSTVSNEDADRFRNEALGLAIGQSSAVATPLQIVRAFAAIANGGWLVTPHVVSPDGTARTTTDIDDRPRNLTRRQITGLSEGTLERIREGMEAVVQQPYGTGYKTVRLEVVAIAGKTGTAETKPGTPDHAWFAGYAPVDQPRLAFAVVLENGGSGSRAAGPVARELIHRMFSLGLLSP